MQVQPISQTAPSNAFLVWRIQTLRQKDAQARIFRGVLWRRHDAVQ